MNEGKLYQSQRITLVSNISKLFAGTYLEDLANEQIGIFAQDGRNRFKATTTPIDAKGRLFKIAQGFPDRSPVGFDRAQLPSRPHQTVEFKANQIRNWRGIKGKPFTKETIVAVGYDGVDATKSIVVPKNHGFTLHLQLTGGPIHKLTATNGFYHREFVVEPDCLGDSEPGTNQACRKIQKRLKELIDEANFGGIPLNKFVKVTPISTCDSQYVPSGLVNFTQYSVNVVDAGTDLDLGRVQAQYPGVKITRIARSGLLSTYQLTQLATASAPAAVSLYTFPVLPNCSSCPTGYTLQASGAVFEVTVPAAVTVADQTGQISKTKLSGTADEAVFQFVMPVSTDPAAFTTTITGAYAQAEVLYIGTQQALCIPPAAGTTAWVSGATVKQAPRTYVVTVADSICGTTRLADIQAKYTATITEAVVGTCARQYSQVVYSDPVADGCGEETYTFTAPEPFEGFVWTQAVDNTTPPTGCSCGVLLEGARYVQPVTEVTYPYIGYDKRDFDVVYVKASAYSHDYTQPVCPTVQAPFTALQEPDFPIGYGRDVVNAELESLSYFGKEYNFHPLIREIYGDKFLAKPDIYYDEYQLEIETFHKNGGFFDKTGFPIIYRFFFPVGQGKEFEAAINKLVASIDSNAVLVDL